LPNGEVTEKVKSKGFARSAEMEQKLNYAAMKKHAQTLIDGSTCDPTVIRYQTLARANDFSIQSKEMLKSFRATFDKRLVQPDGTTLPIGYDDR
jgi:hypothetical protein